MNANTPFAIYYSDGVNAYTMGYSNVSTENDTFFNNPSVLVKEYDYKLVMLFPVDIGTTPIFWYYDAAQHTLTCKDTANGKQMYLSLIPQFITSPNGYSLSGVQTAIGLTSNRAMAATVSIPEYAASMKNKQQDFLGTVSLMQKLVFGTVHPQQQTLDGWLDFDTMVNSQDAYQGISFIQGILGDNPVEFSFWGNASVSKLRAEKITFSAIVSRRLPSMMSAREASTGKPDKDMDKSSGSNLLGILVLLFFIVFLIVFAISASHGGYGHRPGAHIGFDL